VRVVAITREIRVARFVFLTCRPPLIADVKRVGNDKAGFSVEFEPQVGAIRVRGWGFWDTQISEAFAPAVADACRFNPKGAALQMDMDALKPLREEGQQSFGDLLRYLRGLGVGRTTISTASHLTKLQLLRLVAEHAAGHPIEFTTAGR
jgi:hypothetical protein